ncbi:hypothetical protein BKA70DRAFT_1512676 [Coprinopsis sp. MPI-PUGE-AT-0042]|nr:hypothetical protein BKA70DRAFT_1512676 [Coprinopsis sp. MPI-PUGE-AT-0042]
MEGCPSTPFTPRIRSDGSQNVPTPSSSTKSPRASPKSTQQKLDIVLKAITDVYWNISTFLYYLFRTEDVPANHREFSTLVTGEPSLSATVLVSRSPSHEAMISSLLNGTTKPRIGCILNEIWKSAINTSFLKKDSTKPTDTLFNSENSISTIQHAQVALISWSGRLLSLVAKEEADSIVSREAGLHLRARVKAGSKQSRAEEEVTWHDENAVVDMQQVFERSN